MKDLVGKKDLAAEIGWSRPTLDKRLKTDPNFPVANRGDQAGGWLFSVKAVRSYLGSATRSPEPTAPPPIDVAQLRDTVAAAKPPEIDKHTPRPRASAHHLGEATARQRIDEAKARKLEREEAEAAQLVVPVAEMRQKLAQLIVQLASDLDALPEEIARAGGLPEDTVPGFRTLIDRVRTEMHRSAKSIFTDG